MNAPALAELLARCALGDREAFERLYRNSSAKLFGVSLRILRRRDWAEEVLQEAFLRIWYNAGDFNPALSSPMTWMSAIVRNRSLDWLRRPGLQAGTLDEALIESWPDESPGPLARLQSAREARALAACLEGLEAKQQRAVTLAFMHGLTHPELAAQMGAPLGSVKTWVRRGLARLRDCLEGTQGSA